MLVSILAQKRIVFFRTQFFLDQDDRLESVETTVLDQADQISNLEDEATLLSDRIDVLEETDVIIQSDITGRPRLI